MAFFGLSAKLGRDIHRRRPKPNYGDFQPGISVGSAVHLAVEDASTKVFHSLKDRDIRVAILPSADEKRIVAVVYWSGAMFGVRDLPSAVVQLLTQLDIGVEPDVVFEPKVIRVRLDVSQEQLVAVVVGISRRIDGKVTEVGGIPTRVRDDAVIHR